jgi:hypothetical protein
VESPIVGVGHDLVPFRLSGPHDRHSRRSQQSLAESRMFPRYQPSRRLPFNTRYTAILVFPTLIFTMETAAQTRTAVLHPQDIAVKRASLTYMRAENPLKDVDVHRAWHKAWGLGFRVWDVDVHRAWLRV